MSNLVIILGILILVSLIFAYKLYVSVIQKKNKAKEAYSSVSVQLKKRYDLIPNILTIANKFMEHEKGLLEEITKLRSQALMFSNNIENAKGKLSLDAQIKDKMTQIIAAVENYPQLKSDNTMLSAMRTYNEVEEHIAAARRFYNAAALELNNAVEIFPSSLIANALNIKKIDFFEISENETKSINASNYLK